MTSQQAKLSDFIPSYQAYLASSFDELWSMVPVEADKLDAYSAIGGLLSRQVTLAMQLAGSPGVWNGHSAPLFLRAMTDLHITLSWILLDIDDRGRKYIMHGLGEVKLLMGHYEAEKEENPDGDSEGQLSQMVDRLRAWINAQRKEFFVAVNLGNWAQLDYRAMANESGNESLYKFAYKPFSQVAHNMWPHVSAYNCRTCENSLHRHHLIPELLDMKADVDYVYLSCKYVNKTYAAIVERFGITLGLPMPHEWWDNFFSNVEPNDEDAENNPAASMAPAE